jgi:predicted transcriptional regulator
MKQISIQITDETARQMARLAKRWGLPPERHNTPVIERAIATIFVLEIGYEEYTQRLKQIKEGDEGG